jgi:hypothetical protein
MEEISKIGEINSINDLLNFKLSVKTIIGAAIIWGGICLVAFVFFMGGVNNAILYVTNLLDSTKKTISEIKSGTGAGESQSKKSLSKKNDESD